MVVIKICTFFFSFICCLHDNLFFGWFKNWGQEKDVKLWNWMMKILLNYVLKVLRLIILIESLRLWIIWIIWNWIWISSNENSDEVRMWVFEETLQSGEKLTDVINRTNVSTLKTFIRNSFVCLRISQLVTALVVFHRRMLNISLVLSLVKM